MPEIVFYCERKFEIPNSLDILAAGLRIRVQTPMETGSDRQETPTLQK